MLPTAGGSFGVVYKGIEKATGETVAIKHVSKPSTGPIPNTQEANG
jgi:serine/threonine protein kinase